VLAGAYTNPDAARADALRLKSEGAVVNPRIVSTGFAAGLVEAAVRDTNVAVPRPGTRP